MAMVVVKVPRISELSIEQREALVRVYRTAFASELAWIEKDGRSTTSSLSVAAAFSYVFDGKHLFLAIRVTDKADVEPPETSWIEEVTERSVGANQSPFTPKKKPMQPAQINIRQIAPGNIVGFATVEQVYKHVDAFLRCIAVTKKAQRLGVGGYLLKFLTKTYGPSAGQSLTVSCKYLFYVCVRDPFL